MLQYELPHGAAGEGPHSRQQFLIDDGQAVLIAEAADAAIEGFRSGVDGRDAAGDRGAVHALEVLDEAEIGHLDVIVREKDILRLDVQMLQLILDVHQIERFGRSAKIVQQLRAWNARQPQSAALLKTIPDGAIGQLHDDDQLTIDDVVAFQRQDIRVMDRLDAAESLEFLFGPVAVVVGCLQVAENEFDGLEQAAGSLGSPDLAEAAAAKPVNQLVTRNGL